MATATLAPEDVAQLWLDYKANPDSQELRNRLVEQYLPLDPVARVDDVKPVGHLLRDEFGAGRSVGHGLYFLRHCERSEAIQG